LPKRRGSVRLNCIVTLLLFANFVSSRSMRLTVCQFPDTSSSIATSEPNDAILLSLMLPPQSMMTRVSSCTTAVGSPPTAEMTMSCSI